MLKRALGNNRRSNLQQVEAAKERHLFGFVDFICTHGGAGARKINNQKSSRKSVTDEVSQLPIGRLNSLAWQNTPNMFCEICSQQTHKSIWASGSPGEVVALTSHLESPRNLPMGPLTWGCVEAEASGASDLRNYLAERKYQLGRNQGSAGLPT